MDPTLTKALRAFLEAQDDLVLALVYGSVASGRAGPKSDLDIAVAGLAPLSPERLVELSTQISLGVGREVDLLDLQDAHGTILQEVLVNGVRIFSRSPEKWEELIRRQVYEEADFMPLYRRLLRERRERFLGQ